MWGCFRGVEGGVTSDIDCTMLTVLFTNLDYSEIKGNSHLFLKNPKWLPNTSHNKYAMMHLGWVGVDLLADLPRLALTTILHITPGKYEPSLLKFVIVIWGLFWGVLRGYI